MPSARSALPIPDLAWFAGLALLLWTGASRAVLLDDASSITSLTCVSVMEPIQISTSAASRAKYQLAVAQIAMPRVNVNVVPVSMSTAGNVAVSPLAGLLAASGTYVSSTESLIFTNADVFAHTMRTSSPAVLADDYDIVQTLDLSPDHVYFVNVYAGCNFALAGT